MSTGTRNLPITTLVKATYFCLTELFATKGREAHARKDAGFVFSEALMTRLREKGADTISMTVPV